MERKSKENENNGRTQLQKKKKGQNKGIRKKDEPSCGGCRRRHDFL